VHVYVQSTGLSWLLLIEGAIEVCNARDDCRLHDEPGKLIRITPTGDVGNPVRWVGLAKTDESFETAFPFVVTPPKFDPDPIFTPDEIVGGTSDGSDNGSGSKDEGVDEASDDAGTAPPSTSPQLHCWTGWKEVQKGWGAAGWRAEQRERAGRVVYCAKRVTLPPTDTVDPTKPTCSGGSLVMLKTLPPRCGLRLPRRHDAPPDRQAFVCVQGHPGRRLAMGPEKRLPEVGMEVDAKGLRRSEQPVPERLHRQSAQLHEADAEELPEGLHRPPAELHEGDVQQADQRPEGCAKADQKSEGPKKDSEEPHCGSSCRD
jgi:hypothetical protein